LIEGVPGEKPYVFFTLSAEIVAETAFGRVSSAIGFTTKLTLLKNGKRVKKPLPFGWMKELLAAPESFVLLASDRKSKQEIQNALRHGLQTLLHKVIENSRNQKGSEPIEVPDELSIRSFKAVPDLSLSGDGGHHLVLIPGYSLKLTVGEPLPR
jgi:hypothetical protein